MCFCRAFGFSFYVMLLKKPKHNLHTLKLEGLKLLSSICQRSNCMISSVSPIYSSHLLLHFIVVLLHSKFGQHLRQVSKVRIWFCETELNLLTHYTDSKFATDVSMHCFHFCSVHWLYVSIAMQVSDVSSVTNEA